MNIDRARDSRARDDSVRTLGGRTARCAPELTFTVDDVRFPLVRIDYPRQVTPEGIEQYVSTVRRLFRRGPCSTIVDIRRISEKANTAVNRRLIAEGFDALMTELPGRLISEAVILESALMRGAYLAYTWIVKSRGFVSRAFPSIHEAEEWTCAQLKQAGVAPPTR